MELYDVVLFGHITTAICAFGVAGVLHGSHWGARKATTLAELRGTLRPGHRLEPLFPVFLLLLVGLGAWLVQLSDEEFSYDEPWLQLAVVAVVVLFATGGAILAPRAKAAWEALQSEGPLTADAQAAVNHPLIWLVGHFNTALALTVVFLMTTKPGWAGALTALVVGPALGLLIGSLGLSRARRPVAS